MPSIIRSALALSAFAGLAVAQQSPAPKTDAACADAVIVMARGNDAPYHDWRTFPFVDATCKKLRAEGKTCDFLEVEFGSMVNGDFCKQIGDGVRNGQAMIKRFNKKCPCTHLILNGFSQGAWITGDIVAGPGGCTQVTDGFPRDTAPGDAIAAILLWGDVMHEANMPYNVLDGSDKQRDGRSADSLARLNKYSDVLRSYCAKEDPICAGGHDVAYHLNYFELYTDDASSWAVEKFNEAKPLCAAPTPTPSASSSVVSSSAVASSSAAASSGVASSVEVAGSSAVASSVEVASSAVASSAGHAVPSASYAVPSGGYAVPSGGYAAPSGGYHVPSAGAGYAPSVGAGYGSSPSAAASHALPPAPTSPVHVAPFPIPEPYEPKCVPIIDIVYVYA